MVIDVDHFKSINDRFGHTAGDITLQVIAKALQKSIRQTDFIARYGGEEFVLLMPRTSLDNAVEHLNKLRLSIKKIPFKFKDKQIQITVSLGATQFEVGDTPLKRLIEPMKLYTMLKTQAGIVCVLVNSVMHFYL